MRITFQKFLTWFLFFIVGLTAGAAAIKYEWLTLPSWTSPATSQPQSKEYHTTRDSGTKKERWNAMEKNVASWTDALGLGIDPGIKKMVIVLNLLDFKTEQSCEGHPNWGRPYPWVSISAKTPELDDIWSQYKKVSNLIEEHHTEIQKKHPDLSLGEALRKEEGSQELNELYTQRHSLNEKLEKTATLRMLPLKALLAEYYKDHAPDPDTMVYIKGFGFDTFEIVSLGGVWQVVRHEKEKLEKLKAYQQEMSSFADFLTEYYFKT